MPLPKGFGITPEQVEAIRQRFSYLEPPGIAALDFKESFKFQIDHFDLPSHIYDVCYEMIDNIDNIHKFKKYPLYKEALKIIKRLKNPPILDYKGEDTFIIPDILMYWEYNPETGDKEIYPNSTTATIRASK